MHHSTKSYIDVHLGKSILRHALTFIEVNGLELTISVFFPKSILRKLEFSFQWVEKLDVRRPHDLQKYCTPDIESFYLNKFQNSVTFFI